MELCTSNTFETVIALSAIDFLGEFDSMRYHSLLGYGAAEQLMAGVYRSDFWEWLAVEAREAVVADGIDMSTDHGLAVYHRRLAYLSDLAFELRLTMDQFAKDKLQELGYRSPAILQIYFNARNAFVRLG